jgi:hypothetical protein
MIRRMIRGCALVLSGATALGVGLTASERLSGATPGAVVSPEIAGTLIGGAACPPDSMTSCWFPFGGCNSTKCFQGTGSGFNGTTSVPVSCGGSCYTYNTVLKYCAS